MSRRWLIGVSVVSHLAVAAALMISSVWRIERLEAMPTPPERPHLLVQPPVKKRLYPPRRRIICGGCFTAECQGRVAQDEMLPADVVEPPRPGPRLVTPAVLQNLRVRSASDQPQLGTETQQRMLRDGVDRVIATVRVCLGSDGTVASAAMLQSTRYADHNAAILRAVRDWRYRPFIFNGAAVPVCSAMTFIHKIP